MYLLNRSECELQKRSCHLKTHILITEFAPCKCKYLVNSICNTFSNRFTKSHIAYNKYNKFQKRLQKQPIYFLIELLAYNIKYIVKSYVRATFWCEITLMIYCAVLSLTLKIS